MKHYRTIAFLALAILAAWTLLTTSALSQWQKVSSLNVGTTGRVVAHSNAVLLYGSQSGPRLHRSTNNGDTWEEISAGLPGAVSDIFSFNGMLYAVYLSTVYTSTNLGETWTPLSSVTVTGNGALIGMAADGSTLYAFSNRKSVFTSTNNGTSWGEHIINDPGSFTMADFCAVGNRFVATVIGGTTVNGAWISEDGGTNWTRRNPPTAASNVYALNSFVFGLTFGSGVYRMESAGSDWSASNTGVPDSGQFVIPYSATSRGNELYIYYIQLVSNRTGVLVSVNHGQSWTALDTTGFPPANAAGSARRIAANAASMFFYNYATTAAGGVYRSPLAPSPVEESASRSPVAFDLHQNFPNPFNPTTHIGFRIANPGVVSLKVYDLSGREVRTLVSGNLQAGGHETQFDAAGLASGVYFYRLDVNGTGSVKRMLFLK